MDGARLFHAEVATGVPASAFAARATTVMCCLSKGLCAPVGSLLAGPSSVEPAPIRVVWPVLPRMRLPEGGPALMVIVLPPVEIPVPPLPAIVTASIRPFKFLTT
jgi:hypothetical protein